MQIAMIKSLHSLVTRWIEFNFKIDELEEVETIENWQEGDTWSGIKTSFQLIHCFIVIIYVNILLSPL